MISLTTYITVKNAKIPAIYLVFIIFQLVLNNFFTLSAANINKSNITYFNYVSTQETQQINRGPRPTMDLSDIDPDIYMPGVFRIKFSEKFANQIEIQDFTVNKQGNIQTGIAAFDQLLDQFAIQHGNKLMPATEQMLNKSDQSAIQERHRQWGFHLWYEFDLTSKADVTQVVEAFNALESVEFAQPVFKVYQVHDVVFDTHQSASYGHKSHTDDQPSNDPSFLNQWSLNNTGQNGGIAGKDISITDAWRIQKGSKDVIVAVIDGGIQFDHPDLAANMWTNAEGMHGFNFADGSANIHPTNHATHVAGIISAVTNNEIGIAGIAGGSGHGDGVKLMIAQVFSENRCGGFHLAPIYAADNGAAISQNSWVFGAPGIYDHLALDAIDYFNTYGGGEVMQGGITIFAAGNNGSDANYYPACYTGTLAVASTDQSDVKAKNSNFGPWIDIAAPGVNILSTLNNNRYGTSSGTSMACPHVSGVAALIISQAPGMLTAQKLKEILLSTSDAITNESADSLNQPGAGRLNAMAALQHVNDMFSLGNDNDDENTDDQQNEPDGDNPETPEEVIAYYLLHDGMWESTYSWYLDAEGNVPANQVPSSSAEVHIKAACVSAGNILIENAGALILHNGGSLHTSGLIIKNSPVNNTKLTLNPGSRLSVSGELINEATNDAILILADETGSGSLISSSANVNATFTYAGQSSGSSWDMIAVPLTDTRINDNTASGTFYQWDESRLAWVDLGTNSVSQHSEDKGLVLTAGNGYLLNNESAKVNQPALSFSGSLNQGSVVHKLSKSGSPSDHISGLNLMGNPYPSSIDWNAASGWQGREHLKNDGGSSSAFTMWVWNPETGNYGAYNSASRLENGTNQASRFIAPMQAFWVKAATDQQEITIGNEARVHNGQLRAKKDQTNAQDILSLMVTSTTSQYQDEVIIEFGHTADLGGAEKMFSLLDEAPGLYTTINQKQYSINFFSGVSNHPIIPLGFVAGKNTLYTIKAGNSKIDGQDVYLVDLQTGHRHNFTTNNSYHFYGNPADDPDRFIIELGQNQTTHVSDMHHEDPKIHFANGQLQISNPWNANATVQVFNTAGAHLMSIEAEPHTAHQTQVDLKPGVYVVRMTSNNNEYATKLAMW